jgi:hypothetical protein
LHRRESFLNCLQRRRESRYWAELLLLGALDFLNLARKLNSNSKHGQFSGLAMLEDIFHILCNLRSDSRPWFCGSPVIETFKPGTQTSSPERAAINITKFLAENFG